MSFNIATVSTVFDALSSCLGASLVLVTRKRLQKNRNLCDETIISAIGTLEPLGCIKDIEILRIQSTISGVISAPKQRRAHAI